MLKMMIDKYNTKAFTHEYIFGFTLNHIVYMVKTNAEILPYILKTDRASRGQGMSLRFCPTKAQKIRLLSENCVTALCSDKYFTEMWKESKYNKGEIFEKLVSEYFGIKWEKDNIPFTKGGDIEIDGIAYQIKFEKATFTNEKTLARL